MLLYDMYPTQPFFHTATGVSAQMNRRGRYFMYLVDRLPQIFCRTVCKERDNNLPAQVITFQESTDHHGRIMPPDGRTDQNDIIIFYIVGQIGYSRTEVIIRFVLDTATVIIRIAGIRLGRLDTVYVCTCRRYNLVGKAFCISCLRK